MLIILIKTISSIVVSYFFAVMFNVQGEKIKYSGIAGGVCWFVYDILLYFGQPETVAYFLSAVFLTMYSERIACKINSPITSFLIPGLIPIVPGGGVYYTLFYVLNKDIVSATEKGIDTLMLSGALAFGILFVSSITAAYNRMKERDIKYIYKKVVKEKLEKNQKI